MLSTLPFETSYLVNHRLSVDLMMMMMMMMQEWMYRRMLDFEYKWMVQLVTVIVVCKSMEIE
jgi:hypothetical protein